MRKSREGVNHEHDPLGTVLGMRGEGYVTTLE